MRTRVALSIVLSGALIGLAAIPPATAGSLDARAGAGAVSWVKESPATSPPPTADVGLAFDRAAGAAIMFRGHAGATTWSWDGSTWTRLAPPTSPPAIGDIELVFDPVREEVVLFGGTLNEVEQDATWVFADGTWTRRFPATSPPGTFAHATAYDPITQRVIVFGGSQVVCCSYSDQTWAWDGTNWTELHPNASPAPRMNAALAYHPARGRLVLFGGDAPGSGDLNDTWSWDGETWVEEDLQRLPAPRRDAALAQYGRHVALFSGNLDGPGQRDTWVLRKHTWTELDPDKFPRGRHSAAVTWDPIRREMVMFGGYIKRHLVDQTWTLPAT